MDETTLNDLLECSVCLERLDTTSKVLPCQHTFCRKCLEVIVSSRHELRCPECRVLVDTKVDELPSNILLIRILEGMKNATQNQNNTSKSSRPTNSNINSIVTDFNKCEINEDTKAPTNDSLDLRHQNDQKVSNRRILPHAFALYNFSSKKTGDLSFEKGDIILLKRKIDVNWYVGEINGREGAIPMNYVQIIVPLPVPQCVALYDFKMGPNEEEGCLTFKKSTVINVLRRVDHNWAEGSIGSCIGIFPIAFVEMNPLAKQLMESACLSTYTSARILPQVPLENVVSESSSMATTSPNSTSSSNTSTNSIPSSPSSSPQNNIIARSEMKEKRHSLNAITSNTTLSIVQSNRHSAEILTIPEPTEQTPQRSVDDQQTSGNSNRQQENNQTQQHNARANVLKTNIHHNQPNLPWAYVALYPYKPRKSDELELKKGCVYFVTERCLDGWYKGKNWADKSGVFPGNYVTPLRSRDQQQLIHQRKSAHNPLQPPQSITALTSHANLQEHSNSQAVQASVPPPELPPRSNTISSGAVWAKPLGQHVEAFLNKKFSNNATRSSSETKSSNNTPKHNNSSTNSQSSKVSQPCAQTAGAQLQTTPKVKEKEKDKKETNSSSAVSLMNRLTNMKRSKSPPNSNANSNQFTYLMDNPVFEDITINQPLVPTKHNPSVSHHMHVRSGSCPSQLLQSTPIEVESSATYSNNATALFGSHRIKGHKERTPLQSIRQSNGVNSVRAHKDKDSSSQQINKSSQNPQNNPIMYSQQKCSLEAGEQMIHHRKSQSLDANTISSQILNTSLCSGKGHASHTRENSSRFRCVVSYPPNSNVELELSVGDIIYVHRKLKDGWYAGTHARTNKSGLFPASFVEPDT